MNQKLYQETFDEIHMPEKLREQLERIPEQEENKMKYHKTHKFVVVLAAMMVLCMGVTCYAAVMGVRTDSYTEAASLKHGYQAVQDAQKETGLQFYCPQKLKDGYSYVNLNINEDVDYDENGVETGAWKSVYAGYMDEAGNTMIYQVSPIEEASCREAIQNAVLEHADVRTCKTADGTEISLYYEAQQVQIEGSDVNEEESVIWTEGDNFYRISGYDLNLTAEEWLDKAEEFLEQ